MVADMLDLETAKSYLRVDNDADDALIEAILRVAEKICRDCLRIDGEADIPDLGDTGRLAALYAAAYLYEHREEADHNKLMLTLRALLFGGRKESF